MKTNHEENIEKYYQDQDKKIRFKVILYLVILLSVCVVSVCEKYGEIKKHEHKTSN